MHTPPGAREKYDQFVNHLLHLGQARSFIADRLLFRVEFKGKGERDFIPAPRFAPLAYPAFKAGNPSGPIGVDAQLTHCGGKISDRDESSYISCSRDLLWCLWISARAIFARKQISTQIYFIADGEKYDHIQTSMYCPKYWNSVKSSIIDGQIRKKARMRAIAASEVLVYREVDRERIVGVLRLDCEILCSAGLDRITKCYNYYTTRTTIAEFGWQEDIGSLAEWCEANLQRLEIFERSKTCFLREIFNALFFRLRGALLEVVENSERETLHEHLVDTFYLPWLDHLQCHETDHLEKRAHSNPESITPIPVFSIWTILHYNT
jgi:hypothetical protein